MEESFREEVDEDGGDADELVFESFDSEGGQGAYLVHVGGSPRLFGPDWDGPFNFRVGMNNVGGRLEKAAKLLADGWSAARAARQVGIDKGTALKLRQVMEVATDTALKCGCGRTSGHGGNCRYRIKTSPRVQAHLARLPALTKQRWAVERLIRAEIRRSAVFSRKRSRRLEMAQERTLLRRVKAARKGFDAWMEKRVFVVPVPQAEPTAVRVAFGSAGYISMRLQDEAKVKGVLMTRNIEAALPQSGESPLGQMAIWQRCALPKPSFGAMRNIIRERAAAGELVRVGRSTKAPYIRATSDCQITAGTVTNTARHLEALDR